MQHGPYKNLFDLDFLLPSACADALRDGLVQGAILPSIEYQRIDDLKIVPGLGVSSPGPVRSVLLLSKLPVEKIRSLALDTSSRTSACLVQIILRRQYNVVPQLKPSAPNLSEMLSDCDAALMIGDPALATDYPGLLVYDLADEWRRMTGLPFVFALWVLRNECALAEYIRPMQEATQYSLKHLDEIAQSETLRTGLSIPLINSYLTENISFTLEEKNLEGLKTFYRMAHEDGHTAANKSLVFVG